MMHWMQHLHHQPHLLPHDCLEAGAQWSPDIQPYDSNRPIFPVMYSDEDKQVRLKAAHCKCVFFSSQLHQWTCYLLALLPTWLRLGSVNKLLRKGRNAYGAQQRMQDSSLRLYQPSQVATCLQCPSPPSADHLPPASGAEFANAIMQLVTRYHCRHRRKLGTGCAKILGRPS